MIFNYKGKNVLKKSVLLYKQGGDGTSHLCTLIVQPDNTVRVEVDQEKLYAGLLFSMSLLQLRPRRSIESKAACSGELAVKDAEVLKKTLPGASKMLTHFMESKTGYAPSSGEIVGILTATTKEMI